MEKKDDIAVTLNSGVRFGKIAVEKGFITEENLYEAIKLQISEDLKGRPHKIIGSILFEMQLMSVDDIDEVLLELRRLRK